QPPLEDARKLVSGLFVEVASQITTEDSKKIRELVRNAAIREDRKLSSRELENVATAAQQIRDALAPLRAELEEASGSKKGAITKHLHKITDALLGGTPVEGDDAALVQGVETKNLERARELGNGLLREVLEHADEETDLREL